jgi:hypothetical protein
LLLAAAVVVLVVMMVVVVVLLLLLLLILGPVFKREVLVVALPVAVAVVGAYIGTKSYF